MRASPSPRLKILLVTPQLPYPPAWGFGIRVYQLARYLSKRHAVTVLAYSRPDEADQVRTLSALCTLRTVPAPRALWASKRRAQVATLFSGHSYRRRSLHNAEMQRAIRAMTKVGAYDLIQVESSPMAWFDAGRTTVVLDEHNIESELLFRMYASERSPQRRLYNRLEFLKLRREEHHAWRRSDGVILTSDREVPTVRRVMPTLPTAVVPNGVDTESFQPGDGVVNGHDIVFTGALNYRPNVDAVLFFAREILPRIRAVIPDAHFTIVGGWLPSEVTALQGPAVTVTGWVTDVRPYLRGATVVVVPLRMGAGTRLKVVEGLAMAKAVVSTTLGAEGLLVNHGEHLLIADDPAAFAHEVVRVLDDRRLRQALGREGRSLVEREYSWNLAGQRLEAFYARLLSRAERVA